MSVEIRNGLIVGASYAAFSFALHPEDWVERVTIWTLAVLMLVVLNRLVFPKLRAWRDSL
jgi:hypothetical protein